MDEEAVEGSSLSSFSVPLEFHDDIYRYFGTQSIDLLQYRFGALFFANFLEPIRANVSASCRLKFNHWFLFFFERDNTNRPPVVKNSAFFSKN